MGLLNWLNSALDTLDDKKARSHKEIVDYVAVFYGFVFAFIYSEAIKNTLKFIFSGEPILGTSLTPNSLIYFAGVVSAIAVHGLALSRLLPKLARVNLYVSWADPLRFGWQQRGKITVIFASHCLAFLVPFYYIEYNRYSITIPFKENFALRGVDMTIDYWNYAALDILMLLAVAAIAIYIKKVY